MSNPSPESVLAAESSIPLHATTNAGRFTRDGSDALETSLERLCQDILARIRAILPVDRLDAVLLGGGYGRGEGGVLRTEQGERPYNDLEFYVCVRGDRFFSRRRSQRQLHCLAAEMTPRAGIDVELQTVSWAGISRSPVSMFYYDLIARHRWIWGDATWLARCDHLRAAHAIPASEATRLLMNRCTGLLLARQKLKGGRLTLEDADFVGRNIAKAQLALGDAVLTSFGQYDWSCLERGRRLQRLLACRSFPWGTAVARHHVAGLEFKLHPQRTMGSIRELAERHAEITELAREVWLWLENRRLGQNFQSPQDYAEATVNKCPETDPWRNCLLNVLTFPSPAHFTTAPRRHPRERVLHALALLLWGRGGNEDENRSTGEASATGQARLLRDCLCTDAESPEGLLQAYLKLWKRFQ